MEWNLLHEDIGLFFMDWKRCRADAHFLSFCAQLNVPRSSKSQRCQMWKGKLARTTKPDLAKTRKIATRAPQSL